MVKEVQVKNYRITLLRKPLTTKQVFNVDVRAVSKEEIKEIAASDLKDPILREIASDEKIKIHQ